jgi:hypothetical protein
VHRLRGKYQRLIREAVSRTVAADEDIDDEILALQSALRSG